MPPAKAQEQLQSARRELERICTALESPSPATLDSCAISLQRALAEVAAVRNAMTQPCKDSAGEARRLRTVLQRARYLLDTAANYHSRWHAILAGMNGGYTGYGAPAQLASPARILVEG